MKSIKGTLLKKVGFVYFRGRWIPRFLAKSMLLKLRTQCGGGALPMIEELSAALYGHDKAKEK